MPGSSSSGPIELRHGSIHAVWNLSSGQGAEGDFQLQHGHAGPILMSALRAVGFGGEFLAESQRGADFYGVLFLNAGRQSIRSTRRQVDLDGGNILVWSSRSSAVFEAPAAVVETQLLIPAAVFEAMWPHLVPQQDWLKLSGHEARASLAQSGVSTLWQRREQFEVDDLQTGLEAAMDLLEQSQRQPRLAHRSRARLYEQVGHFIERELENPALGPQLIAQRHGCSVRALHALFAEFQSSVASTIRQRRLERCRTALQSCEGDRIGEIALRWGFSDAAHFSKLFKSTYGLSPRMYRASAQN